MKLVRAFVAVPLPDDVRRAVADQAASLDQRLPSARRRDVRWVAAEGLHITVKFLGHLESENLDRLWSAALGRLAGTGPISLEVRGLGAFPSMKRASVLWAGVDDPSGSLARVAATLDAVAAGHGVKSEDRAFRGHITIGRVRGDAIDARTAMTLSMARPLGALLATEIVLFESHTEPSGARHVERARGSLGPRRVDSKPGENQHDQHDDRDEQREHHENGGREERA